MRRLTCLILRHKPRWTIWVLFGFAHPTCERCRRSCPRS